jgi:hypothetical protein
MEAEATAGRAQMRGETNSTIQPAATGARKDNVLCIFVRNTGQKSPWIRLQKFSTIFIIPA